MHARQGDEPVRRDHVVLGQDAGEMEQAAVRRGVRTQPLWFVTEVAKTTYFSNKLKIDWESRGGSKAVFHLQGASQHISSYSSI